ncbi:MAG: hypothetical protein NZM26_04260 [Patescibacteria group bacterium]|nr:hypothetical protein [Patescibacteria group bacterium]
MNLENQIYNLKRFFNKKNTLNILTTVFLLLMLPVGITLTRQAQIFFSSADENTVRLYLLPSNIELPPDTMLKLMVDAKSNKIGFVRAEIVFDPSQIDLVGDISTSDKFKTIIEKTSKEIANSQGKIALVLGVSPADRESAPSGVFEIASVPIGAKTDQKNIQAVVSIDQQKSQVVSMNSLNLAIDKKDSNLTINPVGLVSLAPELTVTQVPTSATITYTKTPTLTNTSTPTPTLATTNTPSPRATNPSVATLTSTPTASPIPTSTATPRSTLAPLPIPTSVPDESSKNVDLSFWLPGIALGPKTGNWNYPDKFVIKNISKKPVAVKFNIDYWKDAEDLGYKDLSWTQTLEPDQIVEYGGGKICGKWSLIVEVGKRSSGAVSEPDKEACALLPTVTPTPVLTTAPSKPPVKCTWWRRLLRRCNK